MGRTALALFLLCTPAAAFEERRCYPVSEIEQRLTGQKPDSGGIENAGLPTFVFLNPRTLEWTLLMEVKQFQENYFCTVAKGVGWKSLRPVPGTKL